jgi:chromosome segregation ATPase
LGFFSSGLFYVFYDTLLCNNWGQDRGRIRLAVRSKGFTFKPARTAKGASMAGQTQTAPRGKTSLDKTLQKSEEVAADVQRASDNLAVVSTVLEQELPDEIQVGEVAQAIEHTSQLEEKLAKSAEKLAEVNAALSEEIEKRIEVTAERDASQALAEKLKAKIRANGSD